MKLSLHFLLVLVLSLSFSLNSQIYGQVASEADSEDCRCCEHTFNIVEGSAGNCECNLPTPILSKIPYLNRLFNPARPQCAVHACPNAIQTPETPSFPIEPAATTESISDLTDDTWAEEVRVRKIRETLRQRSQHNLQVRGILLPPSVVVSTRDGSNSTGDCPRECPAASFASVCTQATGGCVTVAACEQADQACCRSACESSRCCPSTACAQPCCAKVTVSDQCQCEGECKCCESGRAANCQCNGCRCTQSKAVQPQLVRVSDRQSTDLNCNSPEAFVKLIAELNRKYGNDADKAELLHVATSLATKNLEANFALHLREMQLEMKQAMMEMRAENLELAAKLEANEDKLELVGAMFEQHTAILAEQYRAQRSADHGPLPQRNPHVQTHPVHPAPLVTGPSIHFPQQQLPPRTSPVSPYEPNGPYGPATPYFPTPAIYPPPTNAPNSPAQNPAYQPAAASGDWSRPHESADLRFSMPQHRTADASELQRRVEQLERQLGRRE